MTSAPPDRLLSPRERYKAELTALKFCPDAQQQRVVEHLQALYEALLAPPPQPAFLKRLLGDRTPPVMSAEMSSERYLSRAHRSE